MAFVGLGLHNELDISERGLQEMRTADVVFAESYTSMISPGSLDKLAAMCGRKIEVLDRTAVEDGSRILAECVSKKVVLLVAGDPMSATTHVDLRLRATRENIETVVVHNASIFTAVAGLLGLQHYKFGRTTTLPFPQEGYSPTSPYEVVSENLSRGLHTLILLDIDADNSRYMTVNEGLHLLLDMDRRVGKGQISEHTLVCAVARAGSPDCMIRAGAVKELTAVDFGPPLHSIVIPGRLHFVEEEALEAFAGWKRKKVSDAE